MRKFNQNPLAKSISIALASSVAAIAAVAPVQAQDQGDSSVLLEEVIVTAQKREQSLQDVPVSIQVLGNEQLENLNVRSFEDFIDFLPTVAYANSGPGYAQVYMRGISSGGDGNHSASMPSVGYYLDEQPVTTINQILDIHMYDIARVEVLSGPQGTLYGQGSQSGTIRIITNKPVMGETEGGFDVELNTVKSGDIGYNLNGFWNIPLGERAAIRLVAWHKEVGGYIDNMPYTMTFLGGPNDVTIDNSDIVKKNFNDVTTTGLRALLKIDLNDNWSVTPGIMYQDSKVEGVWTHNPQSFGDLKTAVMWDPVVDDEWYQASLTLEGSIGDIDVVYAGAYLDRDSNSEYDYSGYSEYLAYFYGPYYDNLYGYGGYCYQYTADGTTCADIRQYVDGDEEYLRSSHELRIQSSPDQRFRWIAGLFYQKQEHNFDLQWRIPGMDPAGSTVPSEDVPVTWQTYEVRKDSDTAAFGELSFDITDQLTITGGARYFEYENSLAGFYGWLGNCTGFYDDNGNFVEDSNGTPQFPCFDTKVLDDVAKGDDMAYKANLEYRIDDDKMIYVTWSEGFRSGGVNRARVEGFPKYEPDFVTNYEFGWKMTLGNGRVRFNGAIYQVDWDNFQFSFLDFAISNLTIVNNGPDAKTKGVEWDMAVAVNDNNTVTFSGSYNDSKLQDDFYIDRGPDEGLPPNATKGTPMPYVPKWQLTGIWRSNFDVGDIPSFFQAAASYTGSRWNDLDLLNDPARQKMGDYTLVNLSAGIERDNWTLSVYVNNVFDERAEIDIFDPGYGDDLPGYGAPPGIDWTRMTNRPRSFGVRFGQRF